MSSKNNKTVQVFTVSQSLLVGVKGFIDPDIFGICHSIRKVLDEHYQQWRIVVTPEQVQVKLQDKGNNVVVDNVLRMGDNNTWPGMDMPWYEYLSMLTSLMYEYEEEQYTPDEIRRERCPVTAEMVDC